jgi:hypothetical protein
MSEGIVTRVAGTLLLLLLLFSEGYPQDTNLYPVRLMFYNVENLFDISNDPVTEDDEFLPEGLRRWTFKRYDKKINSLYKTIVAAGEWEPPAIVGLCEIENRKVLEDLVYGTYLTKFDYAIVHEDSPDPRGIDVCLLYRKKQVRIFNYRYLIPNDSDMLPYRTRSVLYVKAGIMGDTVHLFINHWPSRRGGVLAGEPLRLEIEEMLREKVDSIAAVSKNKARIVIAGDFNAGPDDEIINSLTGIYNSDLSLVNLSENLPEGSGTYRYLGIWEMIDQVIVSDALLNGNPGLTVKPGTIEIFNPDFLLQSDPNYPGPSPYSTYRGYRYQGGFSDHLPVLLDLISK